ncbi:MAG: TAXI family TRAP transporter solute-binding subunit [Gudongella sp.]|nr:TAXI family TRAP transporter solute-binding subunit [Gudongella sp.]
MKRKLSLLFVIVLMLVLGAGCSQETTPEPVQPAESPVETPTEIAVEETEPMTLIAGSASSGGANYLIMAGWGEIINNNTKHRIITEATGGPASNIELMANGDAQIGVIAMSIAMPAFKGEGWAEGKDFSNMRSMFGMHDALMDGITLEKSGIKTIFDLEGKTVSVGPAGGTPALAIPDILDYYGIKPVYVNLGQEDSINALKDGQLDAAFFFGGIPRPAFQELAASNNGVQIGLTDEQVEEIIKELPQYSKGVIPAGTYSYLTGDKLTIRDRYAYAVSADVPEGVVYEIVKATLDNFDTLKEVHGSVGALEIEELLDGVSIPLHKGAARAFEERGIEIPELIKPID